jgi:hypothetical protein
MVSCEQVRRKMVEGVRDVIKTLAKCNPGEKRASIEKDLLSQFTTLCEDTLIELQYSLVLITSEVPSSVRCVYLYCMHGIRVLDDMVCKLLWMFWT